jgi:outer membrane receptor protein involved in Fe transport
MGGLEDLSFGAYYQTVDKESIRNIVVPGFASENSTTSVIDSLGFNALAIAQKGSHRLTFGVDFYRDEVDDETLGRTCFGSFCLPESTEVAVPKSHQTGFGAFVQDRWTAGDALTVHFGLRGDTFAFVSEDDPDYFGEPFDVTDGAVSGNVGLTYAVTEHVNVNAVVARGFRSPNLQERSFQGISTLPNTYIVQNPDLESESSLNYEAGFKVRYDRYFGGVTMFYNDLRDFITFEFIGEDPVTGQDLARFANVAEATIWGIELDLETIFANWWTLFTTVSYTEGDNNITNEPLPLIPPLKGRIGVRYQQPRWWAEGAARIVSRQDRLPEGEEANPGFTIFDIRAGYDFDFGLGIIATLANLADELYVETFNQEPEPGRNMRVSLRYRF